MGPGITVHETGTGGGVKGRAADDDHAFDPIAAETDGGGLAALLLHVF